MPNESIMLTTKDEISFFALASLKSAVSLECKGLKLSRGRSAVAIAKERYNLKGNKERILAQLTAMVEAAITAKHAEVK